MIRVCATLRWRIIRHGPHDERGFGLVAGGLAGIAVVVLAALSNHAIDVSWLEAAVTLFGLTWLIGPLLLPGSSPIVAPEWFRTFPIRPARIASSLAASEAISVGTIITAVALSSFVVRAAPHGAGVILIAIAAAIAQLLFLLWLGRCAAAVVAFLLRSRAGVWIAAVQMSMLLAVCFAGWVPFAALMLPNFAEGDTQVATTSILVLAAVPEPAVEIMRALPTGWGLAAVNAAEDPASFGASAALIVGLLVGAAVLCAMWIALTAVSVRGSPVRAQNVTERRPITWRIRSRFAERITGPVSAVATREIITWFRDPQRSLELRHAYITPLLMILVVVPTNWSWALPFVGVMAAAIAAMVAVNTLALDGTAIWQVLTSPGGIRADARGRQLAWAVLLGAPVIIGTVLLCITSRSPFWGVALGATLAATGAACGAAPLLATLMPAIGADARERVTTGHVGNAAGGQFTVFAIVAAAAFVPGVLAHVLGAGALWSVHLTIGLICGLILFLLFDRMTQRRLHRTGRALLAAFTAGDAGLLQSPSATAASVAPRRRVRPARGS